MGKQKAPRRVAENEALSVGGQIRGSAQKLNLVAALIRGKKAGDALNILSFSPKAMAKDVRKVLASAIANAENNHNLDVDALVVAEASVGKSISLKRFSPRARGRSSRIVKPFSRVSIYAARPGVIIGKKGADIEKLRSKLGTMTSSAVSLNIVEIRKPEIDSRLVAQGVADQLERRIAFRRAMKRAVQSALRLGAEGIRITCAGRLGGAEIARTEWYREGRVPLRTLRGNVDYAEPTAHTAYGVCRFQVWVLKGEILGHDPLAQDRLMMEAQTSGVRPAREERGNR